MPLSCGRGALSDGALAALRGGGAERRDGKVVQPTEAAVPKYFFNLQDGATPDSEGYEFPDLGTARSVAVQTACAMISQNAAQFLERKEWQMSVSDADGLVLFSLTFFTTDAPAVQTVTIGLPPSSPGG